MACLLYGESVHLDDPRRTDSSLQISNTSTLVSHCNITVFNVWQLSFLRHIVKPQLRMVPDEIGKRPGFRFQIAGIAIHIGVHLNSRQKLIFRRKRRRVKEYHWIVFFGVG